MRKIAAFILFFFFTLYGINKASAQDKRNLRIFPYPIKDTVIISKDSVQQTDLYDIIKRVILRKKDKSDKKDSVTSKPILSVIPAVGYTLTSGFVGNLSGNLIFRTSPEARISSITTSVAYTSKKQFTVPIESTIWSKKGGYVFIGDYRFYLYQQSTYGLGSNSNFANDDLMKFNFIRFYEIVLKQITGNLYAGGGYIFDYHGHISDKGNINGTPSDYSAYGPATHAISSGLTLNGLFDSRDNAINPSKGSYAALQYRDSYHIFGSTEGWRSLIVDLRHYINFPDGSDNVLALWNYDWLILSGKPSYLDLPATAWDSYSATGRGYIQGRFRGAQMVYLEAEYRYRISANGLFGGVIFVNAQSFSGAPGTPLQSVQPAFGPGLRIKLNKVSKTNVSIDYGFGTEGSRGLFVCVGELF